MRTTLDTESMLAGVIRDLFCPDSRKVVTKEAPANNDWAIGTPRNSRPPRIAGRTMVKNPTDANMFPVLSSASVRS